MSTDDSGYGISVELEQWKEAGETREEWRAHHHTWINLKSSLDCTADHGYTRDEVFAIYRWSAGVLARIALRLEGLMAHNKRDHRCHLDPEPFKCGLTDMEHVVSPRHSMGSTTPPSMEFTVPTKYAEGWLKVFRRVVAEVLADDLEPLAPEPEAHPVLMLTNTDPTAAKEERTT